MTPEPGTTDTIAPILALERVLRDLKLYIIQLTNTCFQTETILTMRVSVM